MNKLEEYWQTIRGKLPKKEHPMEHIANAYEAVLPTVRAWFDEQGEARKDYLTDLVKRGREADHYQQLVDYVYANGEVNKNEDKTDNTDAILKAVAEINIEETPIQQEDQSEEVTTGNEDPAHTIERHGK